VQAGVSGGKASASVSVPGSAVAGPISVQATYSNPGSAFATTTQTVNALLTLYNEFFPGSVTINADGSEVVTVDFFFLPIVFTYNAQGALVSVTFGGIPLMV
jgi:hypothetical protein